VRIARRSAFSLVLVIAVWFALLFTGLWGIDSLLPEWSDEMKFGSVLSFATIVSTLVVGLAVKWVWVKKKEVQNSVREPRRASHSRVIEGPINARDGNIIGNVQRNNVVNNRFESRD
jgi:hypothetical protein